VRLLQLVAEQRDKHVLSHVRPHLHAGERVLGWARARVPGGRRQGYCYLTEERLLTVWPGRPQHDRFVRLADVECWGIDGERSGGPALHVESDDGTNVLVDLPVGGSATARRAGDILRHFAERAPAPRRDFQAPASGAFAARPVDVEPRKRSAGDHTRRVAITVIGLLLIAAGAAIAWIPGPWSLPIVLAGLALLASEYDWAQDVLDWSKDMSRKAKEKIAARRADKRT
jgi:hypothetical protein